MPPSSDVAYEELDAEILDSIDVMHPGDMIRVLNEEFDKRTALHDAELYSQMAQLKMESSFQDFAASLDLLAHMIEGEMQHTVFPRPSFCPSSSTVFLNMLIHWCPSSSRTAR